MVDFHIHSLFSEDGEFSPAELVERCAKAGITRMAITDHNCVRANAAAGACAARHGIGYVPGTEIDCRYAGVDFHLLGYGMDWESTDFAAIEQNVERQSRAAAAVLLDATRKLGFDVTEDEMRAAAAGRYWKNRWTGEMFAEVLLKRPDYAAHPLLRPYRAGGPRGDNPYVNFYWDHFSQGTPGYFEFAYPAMADVIGMIHRNGGVAVLAHPGVNLKGREELLPGIRALGLDGLEVCSSYHTPAIRDFYRQRAKELGLFCTGGSDFHGKTKPAIVLGGIGGEMDEKCLPRRS